MSENPGFPPARIEAAARAYYGSNSGFSEDEWDRVWREMGQRDRDAFCESVALILKYAFPELASGEAWVAPTLATEAMAFSTGTITPSEANVVWQAMREAHLKDHLQPDILEGKT
jgi:hypothetical protein